MMTFTNEKLEQYKSLIERANNIVITAHKSPDADSVGSSLGLYHYLSKQGIFSSVCHPDPAPDFLHWMEGYSSILNFEDHQETVLEKLNNADLIFCLDYNGKGRIGKMDEPLSQSNATRIMIDHHRDPDQDFCQLLFSDQANSSTSQLIVELIMAEGNTELLDEKIGTPLYAGIMMDTGSFRFPSTSPLTHEITGLLIQKGVKHWLVHENIHDSNSLYRIRLSSYALLEKLVVKPEYQSAYISLSQEEQERFNATKGDTEGLVNQILSLEGVRMAVFMKESDGLIKFSFRSKGDIPVNDLARDFFEGGGHKNAAGGKFLGKLEKAIEKLENTLPKFYKQHSESF